MLPITCSHYKITWPDWCCLKQRSIDYADSKWFSYSTPASAKDSDVCVDVSDVLQGCGWIEIWFLLMDKIFLLWYGNHLAWWNWTLGWEFFMKHDVVFNIYIYIKWNMIYRCMIFVFSCDQAALRTPLSVCLSVRLSVTPFSLCSCHLIITKF